MKLLTKTIEAKLRKNGVNRDQDHAPVVKFFDPFGAATWLISEIDEDGDTMFGLCDLGFGCPELGSVSLREMKSTKTRFGLGIERDRHFRTERPMSEFANEARATGRINA